MSLRVLQIADRGKPNLERVHIKVEAPVSLSYYLVLHSSYITVNGLANGARPAFWFPNVSVATGQDVVLYTRAGQYSLNGNAHFFFWGLNQTLWNSPADCAVLMQALGWQATQRESGGLLNPLLGVNTKLLGG